MSHVRQPCAILLLAAAIVGALLTSLPRTADAQEGIGLVRDAEIENALESYLAPILPAAGLNPESVGLYIVNDPRLNAFVTGGQNIFVTTGLIMQAEDPSQVMGVLAHEAGHIAGGHLARTGDALQGATVVSLLGLVLGAAAAVAGRPDAAQALILGGQGLGQQAFFSYSRVQESAADQAALKYLDQAGISTKGLYEFISVLAQQELRLPGRQHPYMRTHPVTQERVDIIHNHLQKSPYRDESLRPELVETHERIRAKLRAFIEDPETTIRRYEDDRGFNGRYARAIAYYRDSKIDRSIEITDGLIRENPENPYLHELRGQILFENGRIAEAAESYQQAVALYPRNSLLRTALGQAQVATNDPALEAKSVVNLREAVRLEQDNAMAWYFLAVAEGRSGNMGLAALAQAEHALLIGKPGDARSFATRAQRHLDEHSPAWLRAEDILTALKAGRGRR